MREKVSRHRSPRSVGRRLPSHSGPCTRLAQDRFGNLRQQAATPRLCRPIGFERSISIRNSAKSGLHAPYSGTALVPLWYHPSTIDRSLPVLKRDSGCHGAAVFPPEESVILMPVSCKPPQPHSQFPVTGPGALACGRLVPSEVAEAVETRGRAPRSGVASFADFACIFAGLAAAYSGVLLWSMNHYRLLLARKSCRLSSGPAALPCRPKPAGPAGRAAPNARPSATRTK